MSRSYYSEINLHIVWHTKGNTPPLTAEIEPLAHAMVKQRTIDTPGAFVHEIGGTENHVHLAATLPPTLLISDFIGRLKGGTAHDVNQHIGRQSKLLERQGGYGVVSFGTRNTPWVVEYIRNQREHHASQSTIDRLERIMPRDDDP